MGRILLVGRLILRDLQRRRTETALLLMAIMAATSTLTLGLVLHGVTNDPYAATRAATVGPDIIAAAPPGVQPADRAGLEALTGKPGVTAHSGPYPIVGAELAANGRTAPVQAEGRDTGIATVDRPEVTEGSWVTDGSVVVEAALADVLDLHPADSITLGDHAFRVAGVAVTAAIANGVAPAYSGSLRPGSTQAEPGLVWLTQTDLARVQPDSRTWTYILDLTLSDPTQARAFAAEYHVDPGQIDAGPGGSDPSAPGLLDLQPWQDIADNAANLVRNEQRALTTGAGLLAILAIASVAVLVGGRMADQTRRVGLLKAVGGTPGLVAAILLAQHVIVALLAAAAGLLVGRLAAPLLTDPGAGLLGGAPAPSLTVPIVGLVIGVALGVAVAATLPPAVRAARTSTVRALSGSARAPRRTAWVIAISARLPVPLLLGLRIAARRPRRAVLAVLSSAITVSGIVAVLAVHAQLNGQKRPTSTAFDQLRNERLNDVLLVITLVLVALAAVNAVLITWVTVLDSRHASALARALGVTPRDVSVGLSATQSLLAFAGAAIGIPGGIGLFKAVSPDTAPLPPLWWLIAVLPGTVLVVAALTMVPARVGARRPVAEILQAELA
jgi:ABC-type antimicrobial peptide transport system permease subunit